MAFVLFGQILFKSGWFFPLPFIILIVALFWLNDLPEKAALRFGWLAFVIPFMFVASPTLLMQGSPHLIAMNIVTALMGTRLISMAIIGYFLRPIGLPDRIIFAAFPIVADL